MCDAACAVMHLQVDICEGELGVGALYVHPQALNLRLNCVVCARHTCGCVTMGVETLVLVLTFCKLRTETYPFLSPCAMVWLGQGHPFHSLLRF